MSLGVRLRKSLKGSKHLGRGKSGEFESNGDDSYHGSSEREQMRTPTEKKFAKSDRYSDVKTFGRKPINGRLRDSGSYASDDETRNWGSSQEMRGDRRKSGKFESNGDDSYHGRSGRDERRTPLTEKKFARRGSYSDVNTFGRKRINVRLRDGSRSGGSSQEMRGDRRKSDDGRGKRIPFRSEVIDQHRSRGISIGRRRRDVNGDDYEEIPSGGRTIGRELRGGHERERRGHRGERIPFRSAVIDQLRSQGRIIGRRRRDASRVGSEEMMRGGRTMGQELRGGRGRKSGDQMEDMDGSVDSVEASDDKLRLKWKKMDKKLKNMDGDGSVVERTPRCGEENNNNQGKVKKTGNDDAKEATWKNGTESEGGGDKIGEQKPVRRQTRVLDKFGKKIRVSKKHSDDNTAEKLAHVKKKRRVIKIDPYDISNKRLADPLPTSSDHADKNEEKDSEISKNAEFRAILPSPSILSLVEENLLGRRRLTELKDAGYNIKLSAPLDNVPFSTSIERERIEENLFRNKLEFFAAAKTSSSFPPPVIPEIAFAGRSNVGKSSLLNALTRQWGVVRTSDKPGLTQTINFFQLASKLCLVDLPGYGFAYAKDEVKEAWEELVKEYVTTRVGLQRVCLLIDTKWGMKPRDHELIDLMERSRTPYQIVLTKTDLVFPIDVARRAMQIQENLKKNKSIVSPVVMASSKSGAGVRSLRSVLSKITRFVKP